MKFIIRTLCIAFLLCLSSAIAFIFVMVFYPDGARNVLEFFGVLATNTASCGVTKIGSFFIAR